MCTYFIQSADNFCFEKVCFLKEEGLKNVIKPPVPTLWICGVCGLVEFKISVDLEKNSVFEKSKHCFFLLVNVMRQIFL